MRQLKLMLILATLLPVLLEATDGGIQVSKEPPSGKAQLFPQVVKSTSGSCIIAWEDNRTGMFDIYAQKISSSGSRQWSNEDVAISNPLTGGYFFEHGHRTSLSMCEGSNGGAYIAYANWHKTDTRSRGIYIQHVSSYGTPTWNQPIQLHNAYQSVFTGLPAKLIDICDDGNGGCWVTFLFYESGKGVRCYHVDAIGDTVKVFEDMESPYTYICPSICREGVHAVVMCAKWLNSDEVKDQTELFGASIEQSGSSFLTKIFDVYGSNSDNDKAAHRYLDVDVTPAGQNFVHVVARLANMKTPQVGEGEVAFHHASDLDVYCFRYDILQSKKVATNTLAHWSNTPVLGYVNYKPVEILNYRVPQVVGNPNDFTNFSCVIPFVGITDFNAIQRNRYSIRIFIKNSHFDQRSPYLINVHLPRIVQDPSNPGGILVACVSYPHLDWKPSDDFAQDQNSKIFLLRLTNIGFEADPWGIKTVASGYGPRSSPYLVTTNNNNLVIAWCDNRGASGLWKIFAQKYELSTGLELW